MLQIAVAASPQSFVIMQFVDYVYVLLIWKYENFLCSHRSLHTMNGECCRVSVQGISIGQVFMRVSNDQKCHTIDSHGRYHARTAPSGIHIQARRAA
jgi:hypothetical protein